MYNADRDFMRLMMRLMIGFALVLFAVLAPLAWCTLEECGDLCKRNGDERNWTFTQGCYCEDEQGVYNPKDSREENR